MWISKRHWKGIGKKEYERGIKVGYELGYNLGQQQGLNEFLKAHSIPAVVIQANKILEEYQA